MIEHYVRKDSALRIAVKHRSHEFFEEQGFFLGEAISK
jgi:hypothetical protein